MDETLQQRWADRFSTLIIRVLYGEDLPLKPTILILVSSGRFPRGREVR